MSFKENYHKHFDGIEPSDELIEKTKARLNVPLRKKNHIFAYSAVVCSVLVLAAICLFPKNQQNISSEAVFDTSPIAIENVERTPGSPISTDSDIPANSASMTDIIAFSEDLLPEHCVAVIEGKIVNAYYKEYKYQTYDDKFEENGRLNHREYSAVYEIETERVFFGQDIPSTITIENQFFGFCDEVFYMQIGRTYVLALCNAGENISFVGELASGNVKRESPLALFYPFQPQIERTASGDYIVCGGWNTLVSGQCREITVDEDVYWDKLYLVPKAEFDSKMNLLIKSYFTASSD